MNDQLGKKVLEQLERIADSLEKIAVIESYLLCAEVKADIEYQRDVRSGKADIGDDDGEF